MSLQVKYKYVAFSPKEWRAHVEWWFSKILIKDFGAMETEYPSLKLMKDDFVAKNDEFIEVKFKEQKFNVSELWMDEFDIYITNNNK